MVDTREKGQRIERKAKKSLEKNNYKVHKAYMGGKYRKNRDIFNLFDLIAVKEDRIKFIQVKANQARGQKEIKEQSDFIPQADFIDIELWVWMDRVGWRIKRLSREDDKWETILDER